MGLSSLIGYNAIISDLSYFSLKFTTVNNVPFKLPVQFIQIFLIIFKIIFYKLNEKRYHFMLLQLFLEF